MSDLGPAVVRPSWTLGDPPVPGSVPGTGGCEIWLHWVWPEGHLDAEGISDEFLPVEVQGQTFDIEWPFVGYHALHTDLIALGFVNTDP